MTHTRTDHYGCPTETKIYFLHNILGNLKISAQKRHATTWKVVHKEEKLVSKQVLTWTSTRNMSVAAHTSVLAAHPCRSAAAALSSANFWG